MSRGIDFSKLEPEPEPQAPNPTRDIVIINSEDLAAFLSAAATQYSFFGVLFPDTSQSSRVNDYIRTHWDEVGAMSGRNCLLVTTLGPKEITADTKATLDRLVGKEKAEKLARHYRYQPERTASDAFKLAQQAHLDQYGLMPCISFMTDLNAKKQFVQRIPDWSDQGLARFLSELFSRVNRHAGEADKQKRLESLENDLGIGFIAPLQAAHVGDVVKEIRWSAVIETAVANKELISGAINLLLSIFGAVNG